MCLVHERKLEERKIKKTRVSEHEEEKEREYLLKTAELFPKILATIPIMHILRRKPFNRASAKGAL